MEKEWRFKELALNEKYYTGREYPSRESEYTVTLQDGRTITGPLAELFYVQPYAYSAQESRSYRPDVKPEKFLVHKRQKGEPGTTLNDLTYVKLIKLGEEAVEEARRRPSPIVQAGLAREELPGSDTAVLKFTLQQGHSITTLVWVMAVAIALVTLFYWRAFRTLKPRQWQILLALRILAIFAIVLLLFRPVLSYYRSFRSSDRSSSWSTPPLR